MEETEGNDCFFGQRIRVEKRTLGKMKITLITRNFKDILSLCLFKNIKYKFIVYGYKVNNLIYFESIRLT